MSSPAEQAAAGGNTISAGSADPADDVQQAFAYVLRSTRRRPQTEAELHDKLRAREVDGDVADAALARARQVGAVDDLAFARAWVEDRGHKRGYGMARLRRELDRRRVPQALIDDALQGLADRDEFSAATELARSRAAKLPARLQPEAVARRLAGFLVRRGYPSGLAHRIAATVSGLDRQWD